ncbi:MAG: type II secretion system protein [Mycoplasmatota bacterium]
MKKGFTLVELLAVLVILAILSTIAMVSITSVMKQSQEKLLEEQIERIEDSAYLYMSTNVSLYTDEDLFLTVALLKQSGFLNNEAIIDPVTDEEMNGCVWVKYEEDINQYVFTYQSIC